MIESVSLFLLDLLLVEEVHPVTAGEDEEAGWEADSAEHIYLFGCKLVVLQPGWKPGCLGGWGQDWGEGYALGSLHPSQQRVLQNRVNYKYSDWNNGSEEWTHNLKLSLAQHSLPISWVIQ